MPKDVGIISNMKAAELIRTRIAYSEEAFAELVSWRLPKPIARGRYTGSGTGWHTHGARRMRFALRQRSWERRSPAFRWKGKCLRVHDAGSVDR